MSDRVADDGSSQSTGAGRSYARVLVLWVVVLAALYVFQESFR